MSRRLFSAPLRQPVSTMLTFFPFILCFVAIFLVAMPAHLLAQTTTTTKAVPVLFAIQLGTTLPVQIPRYEGGEPTAAVVASTGGGSGLPNKHPGTVQYRDIVFDYLPVPGAALNTVIADVLNGNSQPISGAIVIMDAVKKELSRLMFSNTLVRSVEFSDVDVTLTGQVPIIRIALAVPFTQTIAGSNQIVTYSSWGKGPLKSNFRLLIQELETVSQKAVRVDPQKFTVQVSLPLQLTGPPGPTTMLVLGGREYMNLTIVLPESDAAPFITWHQQLISQPQMSDQLEKTGTLEWLSSDKTKTFVSLQLQHLGIVSAIRVPNTPGYVAVEMYCEKIVPQVF